jgi:hypothetical protein
VCRKGSVERVPVLVVKPDAVVDDAKTADRCDVKVELLALAFDFDRYAARNIRGMIRLFDRLKGIHHSFEQRKKWSPRQNRRLADLVRDIDFD